MRMITALSLLLLPLAVAAGCKQRQPAPAPVPSAQASGYVAKVEALDPQQRMGVLFRAIRDAGQPCQQVVSEKALPAMTGAAWLATCEDHSPWVVGIADDGTATVGNARDLARRR